jgi:hypothetical protein
VLKLDPAHALAAGLVSTGWGTLSGPVKVPQVVEAGGTTSVTFDVAVLGGSFTARAGDTVCFGGMFHEQAAVTGVAGGRMTALLRHSHSGGSWVVQGGAACSAIDFTANHSENVEPGASHREFDYPLDVLGATDATTLLVAEFITGRAIRGITPGNMVLGARDGNQGGGTIRNQRGVITIPMSDDYVRQHAELFYQPLVTISGAMTASFNGMCREFRYVKTGVATCQGDPAHDGDTDTSRIKVAVGSTPYGNTEAVLHRAAEIVDVRNPDLLNTDPENVVDGTLTLEANHLLNGIGSTGHVPHDYAQGIYPMLLGTYNFNPYSGEGSDGLQVSLRGGGMRGDPGLNTNGQAAVKATNQAASKTYLGLGGTAQPPDAVSVRGVFKNMFLSQYSPYPSGSAGVAYGCPPETPADCSNPVYNYAPNLYAGFRGEMRDTWTPFTDEFLRTVRGGGTATTYKQTPAGFGFSAPVTATAVATPMYTPKSSTSDCPKDAQGTQVVGAIWGDGSYLYQCVAANSIKRTVLSTF